MPELPEVETTRRGIAPWLAGRRLLGAVIRDGRLRWPVPADLNERLTGATVSTVDRRAKYLLLRTDRGTAIVHLGMTGSLRILPEPPTAGPHDHVDLLTESGVLRYNDPRRFGSVHWTESDPAGHVLLAGLGPEPLSPDFDGGYLHAVSRRRNVAIKVHLMNSRIVVGVGNIYASEALHRAGIHPLRSAGRVARPRMDLLAASITAVLEDAIRAGGTTIRDFYGGDGQPGWFAQSLRVYGRTGEACLSCGTPVKHVVMTGRATYYCPRCQR